MRMTRPCYMQVLTLAIGRNLTGCLATGVLISMQEFPQDRHRYSALLLENDSPILIRVLGKPTWNPSWKRSQADLTDDDDDGNTQICEVIRGDCGPETLQALLVMEQDFLLKVKI